MTTNQLFTFNGIDGESGDYDLPPMTGADLSAFITGARTPENLAELKERHAQVTEAHLGVKADVDPKELGQAGWGVIFARDADPLIAEALGELIEMRRGQAGEHFRVYAGDDGYQPGETKGRWLARHGMGPGPANPDKVPYYLLIVGGLAEISYSFQYQLDVQYAVGRIHFDTPQEYANYARSVVQAESGGVKLARKTAFFSVANPDDPATRMSTDQLLEPLHTHFQNTHPDWAFSTAFREAATKDQLARLLGGPQTPALLFTGSHGMSFPLGSERQLPHQGALLCQDWPGPQAWRGKGAILQDFYFAGDDLSADANLLGMFAFLFACYGAGTPETDDFHRQAFKDRQRIAPHPFVAQLPRQMLNRPRGGALAVVGHVERAWSYSFSWPGAGAQTTVFESAFKRLLDGYPVGAAFEFFDERYAELATDLTELVDKIDAGFRYDPYELAGMWTSHNDARGYAIIGDPAVRLPVATVDEEVMPRVALTVSTAKEAGSPQAVYQPTADVSPTASSPQHVDALNSGSPNSDAPQEEAQQMPDDQSDHNTLTVSTYASAPVGAADGRILKARTVIDLSADADQNLSGAVSVYLPAEITDADQPYLKLHESAVAEALRARLEFLKLWR